ncbi:MAG: Ldh family oxidoreductase [Candidatus Bathyarchaeota archaeon]|nr:Ldh family oxidoreductase [Candidatus Bathyarchaeota archaeon]
MPIFHANQLINTGTKIFSAAGAPLEEARLVSELLVKSNLVGHDSHGIIRVIQYVGEIEKGFIKPGARIQVIKENSSTAILNGDWNFGQVVAKRSMELAIEKAKKNAIGIVCAFNCNHIGRLADYAIMASENNMIGIVVANSTKFVAPFGGKERVLSTGPICFAFPSNLEFPFVIDVATSVVAEGKVRVALHKGEKIPYGWIIDKDGNPSDNPKDLYDGGALLPLGGDEHGHKGFGLGLAVEVLSGILTGAGCAYEEDKRGNGVFFEVIDVEKFMSIEEFKKKVSDLIKVIKNSKLRPGFKEILIPGELEYLTERKRLKEGIYVPEKTWEEIKSLAKKLGIDEIP